MIKCSKFSGNVMMKLADLLREIYAVAQAGGSRAQCEVLARKAEDLSDMVGWAQGPIDPQGQWLERLSQLQDDLQERYRQTDDVTLVILNETLTRLGKAIARHDADLNCDQNAEDDGEDFS